jgi:hypothetical protein
MRLNNRHIILVVLAVLAGCVEPFEPRIDEEQKMMVIDGRITDEEGLQTITVSISSPYNEPHFNAVTGCVVRVEDDLGNGVIFPEERDGIYQTELEPGFAAVGRAYRVRVITPDGRNYESDYDSLLSCAEIDRLSYKVEKIQTSDPNVVTDGVRFYVDMKGDEHDSRQYMWSYIETWEYHSPLPIQYIWDGEILYDYWPLLDSLDVCYMTTKLNQYQVGSSGLLESNEIRQQPLLFVSNNSPRLEEIYGLLVIQNSLSSASYNYLERLRSQTDNAGGFFESQPASSTGNIYNTEDPEEKVLGYFFASQAREDRIFVNQEFDFKIKEFYCPILDTAEYVVDLGTEYPFYYMYSLDPDGGSPWAYSYPECHNCRDRGGTDVKPDYWPE